MYGSKTFGRGNGEGLIERKARSFSLIVGLDKITLMFGVGLPPAQDFSHVDCPALCRHLPKVHTYFQTETMQNQRKLELGYQITFVKY